MLHSKDYFEVHPPDDGSGSGYYDVYVFHAPYLEGLSERLAKHLKTLNVVQSHISARMNIISLLVQTRGATLATPRQFFLLCM